MLSLKLCDPDATYVPDGMAPGLVSFAIWRSQLSGQSLRVQINRTRQMQRNIAISDPFFKGSQGIICVCDVSDADSFDYVKAFVPQVRESDFPYKFSFFTRVQTSLPPGSAAAPFFTCRLGGQQD